MHSGKDGRIILWQDFFQVLFLQLSIPKNIKAGWFLGTFSRQVGEHESSFAPPPRPTTLDQDTLET